jgi:hypothetical protein
VYTYVCLRGFELDAATQATALSWVNEFILLSTAIMVPFAHELLVAILPSLAHKLASTRTRRSGYYTHSERGVATLMQRGRCTHTGLCPVSPLQRERHRETQHQHMIWRRPCSPCVPGCA